MQSHDAPFQTGSASHSPFDAHHHHPPHQPSPSSFPGGDAPNSLGAHSQHNPSAGHPARSQGSYSTTNTPAINGAPYPGPRAMHTAQQPDRDDASGSRESPAALSLSRHGSNTSTASDAHATTSMSRAPSSNGPLRRVDKGKARAGQGSDPGDDDPDERQRRVERVLQRAEASRLARAFRNRLALASYKASRGWHDVQLDTIEPHLEQEALRRSQGALAEPMQHGHAPAAAGPAAQYPPPPPAHDHLKAYAPPVPHHMYQQQQQHVPMYDMDAVLGTANPNPHPHPSKRPRLDDPYAHVPPRPHGRAQQDLYSAHSVYAPAPQPAQTVLPYSTAGVYGGDASSAAGALPGPSRSPFAQQQVPGADAAAALSSAPRRQQRAAAAAAASPLGSPRARRAAQRSSPVRGAGGQPLSSSDPHFSSFVDAATALTGMARAPSDPSSHGSGSDEGGGGGGAGGGMSGDGAGRGDGAAHGLAQDAGGGAAPFARPATPERQVLKLDGAAPGAGNDSGTAEGAAELMLYLAASPSPVQSRKTVPTTLGDGSGIKGRRLFSGTGMSGGGGGEGPGKPPQGGAAASAASIFGGELGGASLGAQQPSGPPASSSASAALDAPFATSSASSALPTSAPLEPAKSGGGGGAGVFGAPATPGRQRQPSLGGAASWELFINASPSPKRGGGAGAGAASGLGTRGASPPHAAIGA